MAKSKDPAAKSMRDDGKRAEEEPKATNRHSYERVDTPTGSKRKYMTPRQRRAAAELEAGAGVQSPPNRLGEPFMLKSDKKKKRRKHVLPPMTAPAYTYGRLAKQYAKAEKNKFGMPQGRRQGLTPSTEHMTWSMQGEMFLPHDPQTLYDLVERLALWGFWFPGCDDVRVNSTKVRKDILRPESRIIPRSVTARFGKNIVRLDLNVRTDKFIVLLNRPVKKFKKGEVTNGFELRWDFSRQIKGHGYPAAGIVPVVGTHVKLDMMCMSPNPITIQGWEEALGPGTEEDAKRILSSLDKWASVVQRERPAEKPHTEPHTELDGPPDSGQVEGELPNLVRHTPAPSLPLKERGPFVRRLLVGGRSTEESQRFRESMDSRYHRADT